MKRGFAKTPMKVGLRHIFWGDGGGGYWDRLGKSIGAAWRIDTPGAVSWIFYFLRKLKNREKLSQKTVWPKLEVDLTQNVRRPNPKWKTTTPKINDDLTQNEDDLTQNWRRPHANWKSTSPKVEDDQKMKTSKNWRRPKTEDDQKMKMTKNWRRPKNEDDLKMKTTKKWRWPKNEDDQKIKATKNEDN